MSEQTPTEVPDPTEDPTKGELEATVFPEDHEPDPSQDSVDLGEDDD